MSFPRYYFLLHNFSRHLSIGTVAIWWRVLEAFESSDRCNRCKFRVCLSMVGNIFSHFVWFSNTNTYAKSYSSLVDATAHTQHTNTNLSWNVFFLSFCLFSRNLKLFTYIINVSEETKQQQKKTKQTKVNGEKWRVNFLLKNLFVKVKKHIMKNVRKNKPKYEAKNTKKI